MKLSSPAATALIPLETSSNFDPALDLRPVANDRQDPCIPASHAPFECALPKFVGLDGLHSVEIPGMPDHNSVRRTANLIDATDAWAISNDTP